MGRIIDPRNPYNQLHIFLDIVALTTLCGSDTWNEIEIWGSVCKDWLSTFLVLKNEIPSHDTFNHVFQMIDTEEFYHIFLEWI